MKTGYLGLKGSLASLVVALSLSSTTAMAADSCPVDVDAVKAKLETFASKAASTDKDVKQDFKSSTSSSYADKYFKKLDIFNRNAKESYQLVNKTFDVSSHMNPLKEGQTQTSLPKVVTVSMSNAEALAQAAMNEENTKLDLAMLRCSQPTEGSALDAYLKQAGGDVQKKYKDAKKKACKLVQVLADLQDKRNKLNEFRENGYPLFYLHAKEKHTFPGNRKRTMQFKLDLRMYPEYPDKPENSVSINGQPVLLGQLEKISLSYNTWYKWSDNNWTKLNLYQYFISDTKQKDVICPMTLPITGSVKAKLCVKVEDISTTSLKIKTLAKFHYKGKWKSANLATQTIPAPFGYLADLSDMKDKKMEQLKSKLVDRLVSVLGPYGDMVKQAQQWKDACQ